MRIKLQPASATHLPAYNPILPAAAITQLMLIALPAQVSHLFVQLSHLSAPVSHLPAQMSRTQRMDIRGQMSILDI